MFAPHYRPRKISDIDMNSDVKVAIVGKIVELSENSFILKDESGKTEVVFEGKVEEKKLVRVFCSVLDEQLKADAIQNLEKLDLNLFKKVKELYIRTGLNV